MCNDTSPFISAYRENYDAQYVIIRLLEEWREFRWRGINGPI